MDKKDRLKIAIGTAIGTAVALATGGTIAGLQSMANGGGFWEAFADYASENFVDALVTSFAFAAVSVAASNITKCFQCFKEGTLVDTEDGLKPIEEIAVGDKVLAYDEATGEQAYKPVVQLFRNETKEWHHVYAGGEEIICTGGHPFYVLNAEANRLKVNYGGRPENANGVWICANQLQIGDKVLLSNGSCAIIKVVGVEKLTTPENTYNLEVSEAHTYYVSDSKVLVHNMCNKGATAPKSPKKLKDSYLKKNGIDAHELKYSILGKKAPIAQYDIYVDTTDNLLWLGTKTKGKMSWVLTYESLP